MKKSELSIAMGLIFSLITVFILDTDRQADSIRQSTLRLHIIAQDDSVASQHIKKQVKQVTEKLWPAIYCNATSFEDAVTITQDNLDYIQQIADNTLKNLDAGYTSQCNLEKIYFDTTTIDGITLPRGQYTALTIRLGEANGKNWWCVLYPEIRCGIGSEYEDDTTGTIFETNSCRVKLKAVELWQKATMFLYGEKLYDKI